VLSGLADALMERAQVPTSVIAVQGMEICPCREKHCGSIAGLLRRLGLACGGSTDNIRVNLLRMREPSASGRSDFLA